MELMTKTVEREYIKFGDEEIRIGVFLDFCREVEGSTAFMPMRWERKYEDAAEVLIDKGIVGKTNSGSWYVKDEERLEEMREKAFELYDEVREDDE